MEMLNNLKGLLNAKTSFTTPGDNENDPKLNYDAGADILTHFQKQWEELHQINEDNADKAAKLAETIASVHRGVNVQHSCMSQIIILLAATGPIKGSIENCTHQVNKLYETFESVEKALVHFEDLIEQCELQQMKKDHKFQFALYKEKKMNSLDSLRAELATKHAQNLINFELKQKKALLERENVFQEAFKSDMETYKSLGTLPKIEIKKQPTALLEEITLDIDDEELNKFLEDR